MEGGGVIAIVSLVIYPTSRISNESEIVVLDGGVCSSTHPPRHLTKRGHFVVHLRWGYNVGLRGMGSVVRARTSDVARGAKTAWGWVETEKRRKTKSEAGGIGKNNKKGCSSQEQGRKGKEREERGGGKGQKSLPGMDSSSSRWQPARSARPARPAAADVRR
jgi:hypothetical protein